MRLGTLMMTHATFCIAIDHSRLDQPLFRIFQNLHMVCMSDLVLGDEDHVEPFPRPSELVRYGTQHPLASASERRIPQLFAGYESASPLPVTF